MNLETNVGEVKFRTPLLLASGYITEKPDFFLKAQPFGCAGMVTRSLKHFELRNPRYPIAVFLNNTKTASNSI